MEQISVNSKPNNRILLSRNTPVALVVGAASFLGSHLADKLLEKDIQVIGVDDLSSGKRENLSKASKVRNFHLIVDSEEVLDLDIVRMDYIFINPHPKLALEKTIDLFRRLKSRLLLISSIELYDSRKSSEDLHWLKRIEVEIAQVAKNENLNARILRLGPIFGARMEFTPIIGEIDPLSRLIQQALTDDLQKDITLEFSSRALYIDDAVRLAIKCIFAGSTVQKIFDGVSPFPIKVSEIKQILLDPLWYENRTFTPTPLPPWNTPNLEKTTKFLNWHPSQKIVSNLRETLNFFKENEIRVPKLEVGDSKLESGKEISKEWKMEKAGELEGLKKAVQISSEAKTKSSRVSTTIFLWLGIFIIVYALIWPLVQLSWGVLSFRYQLSQAIKSLNKGEFDQSLVSIRQANDGVEQAKYIFYSLEPIRRIGILKTQFEVGDRLADITTLAGDAAQNTILGIQALYKSLKSVTGESSLSPKEYFEAAQIHLSSAERDLFKAEALMNNGDFKSQLPRVLTGRVNSLADRLSAYTNLVKKGKALTNILPAVVAMEGSKTYLVLLQNNNELRPTGGFIGSIAKISFEDGKLKKLEVNDTYALDGQLKIHVEPPKEIKADLDQKDYFLRDSNWEPDFPTSARQAEWFYTKETGERVEGAVALDVSAIEDLLQNIGPLDLADFNEKIDSHNLFEKAISHSEVNFFPGTQAKKSFLTALTQSLFNKLFFLPNQDWPGIVASLGRSLEKKHLSIYLNEPRLFSYVASQNWANIFPRQADTSQAVDFLSVVEANLGANKANYYLDRSYKLETVIGKEGLISHRLRIAYTNRSPSDAFPAGKYKDRLRIYLPFGTKLSKASWAETEITKELTGFVDYGRSGYSMLLELLPKEQKTLVLDYQTPIKLDFIASKASYKLDVIKQAGTLKDPFEWNVTYPINMRLSSDQTQKIGPQEQIIKTDLSTDKTFQLEFSK